MTGLIRTAYEEVKVSSNRTFSRIGKFSQQVLNGLGCVMELHHSGQESVQRSGKRTEGLTALHLNLLIGLPIIKTEAFKNSG